jgi:cytoskeletal protein CcmA (bactofilin family)
MFKKDGEFGGSETIIAQGVKLEGDFKSEGNVVVEGEVNGSLTTSNDLRVSEGARINANTKAQSAVIAGEINGNLKITDKLELLATAQINGDIDAKTLSVTPGAIINGKLSMGESVNPVSVESTEKNKKETKKSGKGGSAEEAEL